MNMVWFVLGILVIPIIFNFCYLFIAVKFNLFKDFTKWLTEEDDDFANNNGLWFFTPPMCLQVFVIILIFLAYKLILRPLYYITFYPLEKLFEAFSKALYKPIDKTIFKNKLDEKQ